jgi:hypothetical protein
VDDPFFPNLYIQQLTGRDKWNIEQPQKDTYTETGIEEKLKDVFNRLSKLKKIEDVDDEYVLRSTPRAYTETKLTIMESYDRMHGRFPVPRIVPDGEGGIVAAWSLGERRVRLRFRAEREQRDYIYYQSGDNYDVERATADNLIVRLKWLLGE